MKRKGYTLIELVVVIAIIAVLAMIIIPAILENHERKNPEPTDDWVIILSESGNQLYNCRQITNSTAGNIKVVLLDGSKLTLSPNNCIVLENASEDLLWAMKKQYIETTTAPVEITTGEE